jgi:hypothetical protein
MIEIDWPGFDEITGDVIGLAVDTFSPDWTVIEEFA